MKINNLFTRLLLFSLLFNSNLYGQSDVLNFNDNNYEEKTTQGIVVVEYWANWNEANLVTLLDTIEIKGIEIYRVNIDSSLGYN